MRPLRLSPDQGFFLYYSASVTAGQLTANVVVCWRCAVGVYLQSAGSACPYCRWLCPLWGASCGTPQVAG